jgi:hypothetical protein
VSKPFSKFYFIPINFFQRIEIPYYVSDKYGTIYGNAGLFLTLVPILAVSYVALGNKELNNLFQDVKY